MADATAVKVEDLPLDKKLEIMRKYNYYDDYKVGKFIDAQDTVNTWCLGQVVASDGRLVTVHYDGWSSKWDMNARVNNYKIAPFRKYSKGYTGQQKVALRALMKFSLEDLAKEKKKVQEFMESDLSGLSAFETTQYIRGHLYIYVDHLLQSGDPRTPADIDAIIDYVNHVLQLIVAWLKKIPKLIHLYS